MMPIRNFFVSPDRVSEVDQYNANHRDQADLMPQAEQSNRSDLSAPVLERHSPVTTNTSWPMDVHVETHLPQEREIPREASMDLSADNLTLPRDADVDMMASGDTTMDLDNASTHSTLSMYSFATSVGSRPSSPSYSRSLLQSNFLFGGQTNQQSPISIQQRLSAQGLRTDYPYSTPANSPLGLKNLACLRRAPSNLASLMMQIPNLSSLASCTTESIESTSPKPPKRVASWSFDLRQFKQDKQACAKFATPPKNQGDSVAARAMASTNASISTQSTEQRPVKRFKNEYTD